VALRWRRSNQAAELIRAAIEALDRGDMNGAPAAMDVARCTVVSPFHRWQRRRLTDWPRREPDEHTMKMSAGRRALDKIYKRRDRYEIPDWQREEVWNTQRKEELIDSILRGWKLPKFYFVKQKEETYEVVDGQQRLNAIYEFFDNELELSPESAKTFGGSFYKDLKQSLADKFDDFEIEFDVIEEATEEELKLFFQRLQQGLPLSSSEKLNAVPSKLRDFCKTSANHEFFKKSIGVANTRYAHFDIMSKVAAIEIEGIGAGLRFEEVKAVFVAQNNFSPASAVAKRIKGTLDFLHAAFPKQSAALKNRTVVQSIISFVARIMETGKANGLEKSVARFVENFMTELGAQVEMGQGASDQDYIRFQRSVSANIKAGAQARQEILLRKAFMHDAALADAFDPTALVKSGITGRVNELGEAIAEQVARLNTAYGGAHGKDLFKATNKTTNALLNIGKPVKDFAGYKELMSDLYFVFRESVGGRLTEGTPASFTDVNTLRTDLEHDVDHGPKGKVASKKKIGNTFKRYAGTAALSPEVLDSSRFVLVQANILSALELDLRNMTIPAKAEPESKEGT
jgi:hypothetical protein